MAAALGQRPQVLVDGGGGPLGVGQSGHHQVGPSHVVAGGENSLAAGKTGIVGGHRSPAPRREDRCCLDDQIVHLVADSDNHGVGLDIEL